MPVSFDDHVALLTAFLDHHHAIVDRLESRVVSVQGRRDTVARTRSRDAIDQALHACFFDPQIGPRQLQLLRGQLAAAHAADGFAPVRDDRLDAAALAVRAADHWDRQRWPGRNGRMALARRLYAVFVLRQLELLSLRIWDDSADRAGGRLRAIESLLDRLNAQTSPDVFVHDARWLLQTAQGALTRQLEPYFKTLELIAQSLAEPDQLAVHAAGAKLTGGHLRSQLRYRGEEAGKSIADPDVLVTTRNSNSMDVALLIRDLVFLLDAYKSAIGAADADTRIDLADAILQGLSADPELLLTRLDLLGAATMLEELFVERDGDGVRCTRLGESHVARVKRYGDLITELAPHLSRDAARFDPHGRSYSPFGIIYGFCADLLSNMTLDVLVAAPSGGVSLENLFNSGGGLDDKQRRTSMWARLPQDASDREPFAYSAEWAQQMFAAVTERLDARAAGVAATSAGRLFVVPQSKSMESLPPRFLPPGIAPAQDHCVTSDVTRAFETGATAFPKSQIALDRREGRFLASAECDGKWFGVSKAILTLYCAQGTDALITGVPEPVVEALRATCPDLVVVA